MLKPALALFTIRDCIKENYMAALERVAEIGYQNIEYYATPLGEDGKPVATPKEIGRKVKELGLTPVSAHVPFSSRPDLDRLMEEHLELGTPTLVAPGLLMTTREEVLREAEYCNQVGQKCKENGMFFCYHTHYMEFARVGEETVLELFLKSTDPELVGIELDSYWAVRSGIDPLKLQEQLGSRCKLLHQKDMHPDTHPVNLFELYQGPYTREAQAALSTLRFIHPGNYAEIGTGVLDIRGICRKANQLGFAQYIIVEQDGITRMPIWESVKLSLMNLSELVKAVETE